ncbi:Zn-dependent hydrolase [Brevibacillus sp. SYSU BS000544]|uniref:Zn-dependent hydrolase n=1 Tax=Brevibacillus sp. SYSU BS000544 TaxID=3416443 RepID=UPI003CE51BDF
MINQARLWQRLQEVSEIGKHEQGGITRLSFTREERQVKDLVASYMEEAGLIVREDAIGNLIGRKEGSLAGASAVLIGSHLDSVPMGGNFDGPLGVLAGVEVLQTMNEQGITSDHPIEVIAFTDEEGGRFQFGMIGSRALAGTLTNAHLQNTDRDGISIESAMRESALDPLRIAEAAREKGTVKAYIELHIEQGKVLESNHLSVGIVSGIAGPLWMKWTLIGEAGHAGATPMGIRKDPLPAAANLILAIEQEVKKYPNAVGTVGQISVKPGGVNVIPGQVEFTLDLRDIDEQVRNQLEQQLVTYAQELCQEREITLQVETLQRVAPAPCSPVIQQIMEQACTANALKTTVLPSGAGHDGMQLKELCPISMIFIRSKDGISHNPAEWSSPEDCADGANVLYHTVLALGSEQAVL